ncbi:hypothetical protein [Hydrogenophaga taeniospiralis]|uniref:hypothetical protein n=1 Tax=Hydrogenophaga taeniospiralis TaxID=65656 RepID=UPI001CF97A6E|nr:hypothetical protein [Hydrogenophaga taeniospiralis]UCU95221.1 hypothetical protein KI616_05005 [Hydrogenophaga taeniospiralis]
MTHKKFVVSGLFGVTVRGYALWSYFPLWIRVNGEKQRNPAFDQNSQHILNLKQPGSRYYAPSLKYCAQHLFLFLKNDIKVDQAEFLIIPSSQKGATSSALQSIVEAICKKDARFTHRPSSLTRTSTIEKLAKGGDRSLNIHLESLDYKPGGPSIKIILDDVTTSGNSLTGAMTIVTQYEQGAQFIPIVFGKTTHDF